MTLTQLFMSANRNLSIFKECKQGFLAEILMENAREDYRLYKLAGGKRTIDLLEEEQK